MDTERTGQWLKGEHLEKEIEPMVQHRSRYSIKHLTDGQDPSTLCRLCGKLSEMVMHLSSGCPVI